VRTTKDGQLVILHDESVARTTGTAGRVGDLTLADLKKLDAAYRWSPKSGRTFPLRNNGIRIPTLLEVFKEFPEMRMNLEIKDSGTNTIHSLCRLIRQHHMTEKVLIASFDNRNLAEFRSICPEVATSAGSSDATLFYGLQKLHLESAYRPDAEALQVPETFHDIRVVSARFLAAAHGRNMRVQVWTVNDLEAMKRLLALGVDGIMTDYPQRLLELVKTQ
jgi:glycerophosphoryl diester phosphodiesterase